MTNALIDSPAVLCGLPITAASATACMADQRAFHFGRPDAIAGHFNDVVGAAHKPKVAVLILAADIAGGVAVRNRVPVDLSSAPDLCKSSASWPAMAS